MNPTMARDGMRYWRIPPDARLRPWISCYWMVEPDPEFATSRRAPPVDEYQLLIPDGHSEIVFSLAGRFARWRVDEPAKRMIMRSSYVIGGRSHSVLTRNIGALRLAGVKLDPRALRELIRVPLGEFRDTTVSFEDLGCRPLLDLEDAVANVKVPEQLASRLDRFFLESLDHTVCETTVGPLVERLRQSRGAQSILGWAREHTVDARTLERRFVGSMGMTPKQYARVVRFKHAYHRLASEGWSELKSHLDDFYDESHLNREFRHFLGTSPLKWLAQSGSFRTSVADHLLAGDMEGGEKTGRSR